MMLKRIFFTLPVILIGIAVQTGHAVACAVCLTGADDAIAEGYNASVFFLMATPYIVGSCIAAGLLIAYRRAVKRRQIAEEQATVPLAWKQEENSR